MKYYKILNNNNSCVGSDMDMIERFLSKVDMQGIDECWNWTGGLNINHYGVFCMNHRPYYAHRCSWKLYRGEIPDGMCILHHCDNRKCVNPSHLFVGSRTDNMIDKVNKNRQTKGENNGNSKLKNVQIPVIRKMHKDGLSIRKLAKVFNIGHSQVHNIVTMRNWREQ